MKIAFSEYIRGRGHVVMLEPPTDRPDPGDLLRVGEKDFRIFGVELARNAAGAVATGLVLGAHPSPPPKVGDEATILRLGIPQPAPKPLTPSSGKPLTLEQVQEGRRLAAEYRRAPRMIAGDNLTGWLRGHAEALLDAAERGLQSSTCDCGRPLSPGLCHVCDREIE